MIIHYVANVRIPSERANAYQILMQCDALSSRGHDVTIVAPRRRNRFRVPGEGGGDLCSYFGLRRQPDIIRLFSVDAIELVPPFLQRLPFVLQSTTFAFAVRRHLLRERADVIYSRDPWTLFLLAREAGSFAPIVAEVHDLPVREAARRRFADAVGHCAGVVAITRGLADDLRDLGVGSVPIEVLPDGVDLARFEGAPSREEARAALALPSDRPLAVYAGHLLPWKGVDGLVEAAAGSARFDLVVVGGREGDRRRVGSVKERCGADNVVLREPVAPSRIPTFLAAADVLVLPNSGTAVISARYTSPLKLFEYMAANRPIVASDLPSIREVLTDGVNAVLVKPDDPAALRAGIERCLDDPEAARQRADRAWRDVAGWTWDVRAKRLETFVRSVMPRERVT